MGLFNARSVCNKTSGVIELFFEQKLDICFLTESGLKKNDKAKFAEFHESKLEVINKPRRGKGGGVGFIYNPNTVKLAPNNVKKYPSFEVFESLLKTSSELIRLCVIYRSTQHTSREKYKKTSPSKFFEEFSDYLDCLASKSGKPVIGGDFNFHVEKEGDILARQFISLYEEKGFQQHIQEPTHISGGTLDLLLTRCNIYKDANEEHYDFQHVHVSDYLDVQKISIIPHTGTTSDHYLVQFQLPSKDLFHNHRGLTDYVSKTIREFSKIDIDTFKQKMIHVVSNICDHDNCNTLVESLDRSLSLLLDEVAPPKEIKINKNRSEWWNAACDKARQERRRAERKYKKNKENSQAYQNYKERQIDANIVIDRRRETFYVEKLALASGNPKETYKIINNLLDKEFGKNLQPNGTDKEVAQNLQSFFNNKVGKIYESIEKSCFEHSARSISHEFQTQISQIKKTKTLTTFNIMSSSEVASVIKAMSDKSCCLDPIPTWLLKTCLGELIPTITLVVNSSLQSGSFPDSLKTAVVRALLKKISLDSDDFSNYRPVSNLSFISKVIEKCVHLQLTQHIEDHGLFPSMQSGYRKNHSCETDTDL